MYTFDGHKPTSKLDPEFKVEWIKRLRDEKYLQGTGSLLIFLSDDTKNWCCLGVGADIYVDRGRCHWERTSPSIEFAKLFCECGWATVALPTSIMKEVGLNTMDQSILMEANDNGATFAEIADFIEEEM